MTPSKVLSVDFLNTGYNIGQYGVKFYGIHKDDEPFSERKVNYKENLMPIFLGESQAEVAAFIEGAAGTIKELSLSGNIHTGMIFDGYETLDFIRRKLRMIVETQELPGYVEEGHFYSPVPSLEDIKRHADRCFIGVPRKLAGIDLNEIVQQKWLYLFVEEYRTLPVFNRKKSDSFFYFYENNNFPYHDAFVLRSFIRALAPRTIIEVGSGFSSCVLLDTNHLYFDNSIVIKHIEPYPQLLSSLIGSENGGEVIDMCLQDVDIEIFDELGPNDILFIDTSHVTKAGSDVNYYLFDILPRLKPGVVIHIHDIGLNFDYEISDLLKGRAWNESYMLRSFLMYNSAFEIIFWNPFMLHFYPKILSEEMPLCWENPGGSIWLQRL